MPFLQDIIHRIEVGGGTRYLRVGVSVLAVVTLLVCYNWRAFKNMSTPEGMDAAQVGRNITEGKGFSTLFVRPFSMYLLKRHAQARPDDPSSRTDPAKLKTMHPDLANPPVYPVVLAGLMKILPFQYEVPAKPRPFWTNSGKFWRYEPDFLIALFNQSLLLVLVAGTFLLARRLFDPSVGWLSALLLLGSEQLWHFSVAGHSTMLVLVIFMGLMWCIALLEEEMTTPKWGPAGAFIIAALSGAAVGVGGLTRYSFCFLMIPLLTYLLIFGGARRVLLGLTALCVFAAIVAPWIARNYSLSGTPFGIAGYSLIENSTIFSGNRLQRSLEPDPNRISIVQFFFKQLPGNRISFGEFWVKLLPGIRQIVQSDLPRLGGSWLGAFFLVGLMVNFRAQKLRRLRYFLLMTLFILVIAQALGRTALSDDLPDYSTENLLVLVAPMALVYGVALFFLLLDQIELAVVELRYVIIGVFSAVACLPLFLAFLPPKTVPVAYPPYYPPMIQTVAGWMNTNEMAMSDIPWAVAWYGQRQCVWLTLNAQSDFFAIHDLQKPVSVLYLTPVTMDSRFLSDWIRPRELSWGSFILDSSYKKEVPLTFPLRKSPGGWLPEQLVLTDWERWLKPSKP